jgi:ribosomal protein S27AE
MVYIVIVLSFALAGGIVGRIKGSSFFLWALISGLFPFIGLAAAVLYRFDTDEPRRTCPSCGHVCMLHDALCTRCGSELDFPDESEILPPVARA